MFCRGFFNFSYISIEIGQRVVSFSTLCMLLSEFLKEMNKKLPMQFIIHSTNMFLKFNVRLVYHQNQYNYKYRGNAS